MPTLSSLALPPPRNWQDFEDLCCDLWSRLWNDPETQKNGRSGQPQAGVDVLGRPNRGTEWAGVQCKLREGAGGLSLTELQGEVEKARTFKPPLSRFVLATTAPRDVSLQEAAREITSAQLNKGGFSVAVAAWDDILLDLASYPDLVAKHYPDLVRPQPQAIHAQVSGQGHVITQIVGDVKIVVAGHPQLTPALIEGGLTETSAPLTTLRPPVPLAQEPKHSAIPDTPESAAQDQAPRSDPRKEMGVWKSRGLAGIAAVAILASIILSYQPWRVAKRTDGRVARGATTSPPTSTETGSLRQPATANRPQDSPVTFREFMTYVYEQASTSIQRDEFLRQHLGFRVTWDGLIGGVYDDNGGEISVIIFDEEDSSYAAFLTFPRILRPNWLY